MVSRFFLAFLITVVATSNAQARSCFSYLSLSSGILALGEQKFEWVDPNHSGYFLSAELDEEGVLEFAVRMRNQINGERSIYNGSDVFKMMMRHFGSERIWAFRARWSSGDNLSEYKENRETMGLKSAALETWTGRMAKEFGFSRVRAVREDWDDLFGHHLNRVDAIFERRLLDVNRYKFIYNNPF